jgi:hypothetical protein
MKFPSIKNLTDNAVNTFKRFPFESLFALTGTIAATIYINSDEQLSYSFYTKIIMTANLGLLLSLAATLFVESKGSKKQLLARLITALVAGCILFTFHPQLRTIDTIRFFLLSLAFHLLVAFAAFTAKGHIQGFWQFNKTLFLRFLASMLYSVVLYLGLAAALSASNFLFSLHIDYKLYGILFAWIAGVFNTIFFLAGVPSNTAKLDEDNSYPKGLKVFTQYVLIPLASVYVIILLAYEAKILILWSLPKGLVSNLILGYAVFGILSILLIYPLRNQEENKWIKTYARSFYFLLIPLLILLFLAVFSRIIPYGITSWRYFLIVLAAWLLFITIYFLLSRKQNIKIIPLSLCVITMLTVYGPQSAISVSQYSQRHKLTGIFKKYGAYNNGKFSSLSKAKLNSKDAEEAISKLNYFVYDNEISGLQPVLDKDISKVIDSLNKKLDTTNHSTKRKRTYINEYELKNEEIDWVTDYLGLSKFKNGSLPGVTNYSFEAENQMLSTKGVDYVLSLDYMVTDPSTTPYLVEDNIKVKQNVRADNVYTLYINNETVSFDIIAIADSLKLFANKQKQNDKDIYDRTFKLPNQTLAFTKQTKFFKVTLQIKNLHFSVADQINIGQVDGIYLISTLK